MAEAGWTNVELSLADDKLHMAMEPRRIERGLQVSTMLVYVDASCAVMVRPVADVSLEKEKKKALEEGVGER